jgi:hypothetical protein
VAHDLLDEETGAQEHQRERDEPDLRGCVTKLRHRHRADEHYYQRRKSPR